MESPQIGMIPVWGLSLFVPRSKSQQRDRSCRRDQSYLRDRSYRNYLNYRSDLNYRSGTVSWFSPTLKGSLSSGVCPPIGRSGLCPSDRRLRCVGPLARSFFAGGEYRRYRSDLNYLSIGGVRVIGGIGVIGGVGEDDYPAVGVYG